VEVLRYTAFSADPFGGNPAGVVLDATGCTDADMQRIAADLAFAETAFLFPRGRRCFGARYFSPLAEVPFCGHATIATGVAYAERYGPLTLDTKAGRVEVEVSIDPSGASTATLVSVAPQIAELLDEDRRALLAALRWDERDLDPEWPPRVAYAGAWHPVLTVTARERLADLDYDFDALARLMDARGWTTANLIWRASPTVVYVRNPFPPGGVVEDPATGSAAAALGGYLRHMQLVGLPARIVVHQGDDMGRPSLLTIDIPSGIDTGIAVTGCAVALA
jgi:PhzF family phenazine biosynthesis protein